MFQVSSIYFIKCNYNGVGLEVMTLPVLVVFKNEDNLMVRKSLK